VAQADSLRPIINVNVVPQATPLPASVALLVQSGLMRIWVVVVEGVLLEFDRITGPGPGAVTPPQKYSAYSFQYYVRIPGEGEKDSGVNVKTIPG
jgi:hypothetical protein